MLLYKNEGTYVHIMDSTCESVQAVIQLLCHCSDGGEESDDSNRPLKRRRLSGRLVNPQQRGETQGQSLQSERDSGRMSSDGSSLRPLDTPSHTRA